MKPYSSKERAKKPSIKKLKIVKEEKTEEMVVQTSNLSSLVNHVNIVHNTQSFCHLLKYPKEMLHSQRLTPVPKKRLAKLSHSDLRLSCLYTNTDVLTNKIPEI